MNNFTAGVRDLASAATASASASLNETVIRLAVTGLSRAGKTVFITSLIQNLLALGQGRNTLPRLNSALTAAGESRLKRIEVLPPGTAAVPHFDFETKVSEMASVTPSWPPRTEDIAQVSLDLEISRAEPLWQKLGNRRVRLDILDYPGEWLLDLPLLERSYADWSAETLARLRRRPWDAHCQDFLQFLNGFDAAGRVDDRLLRAGHAHYCKALEACRAKLGMRYLQPGRFLCPGPGSTAPFMWFFPTDTQGERPPRGTNGCLLRERFETYKSEVRASFFDKHFINFDRQIVLVDVLGALTAGREAFEDTERAIADIAACLDYGSRAPRPVQVSTAVGAWALGKLLPNAVPWRPEAAGSLGQALKGRGIERLAFVATKADHVPAMQRDNLRNLVRAIAETARSRQSFAYRPVSYHAAASVVSTRDGTAIRAGQSVEVVVGVPVGGERDRAFHPGDVPSARPRDSFWGNGLLELPTFVPPRINSAALMGIPHLELDTILHTLIGDRL
jgi:predicted YcjX-like family ATPase